MGRKIGNAGAWACGCLLEAAVVAGLKDPSAEELMTLRLRDVGISLKDPAASDED